MARLVEGSGRLIIKIIIIIVQIPPKLILFDNYCYSFYFQSVDQERPPVARVAWAADPITT